MSRYFCVTVWVRESDDPYVRYIRRCQGKDTTVHGRLTRRAMALFPNWSRITVEVQS